MNDILILSDENLLAQLEESEYETGFYRVKFYTEAGRPAKEKTDTVEEFFLYPSGGTLRDKDFNIIFYNPKYDTYRGFTPPHLRKAQ